MLVFIGAGLYLVAKGVWPKRDEPKDRKHRAVPILVGLAILTTTFIITPDAAVAAVTGDSAAGLLGFALVVVGLLLGLALGDYVFGRLVPLASKSVDRAGQRPGISGALIVVAGAVMITGIWLADRIIDPAIEGEVGESTSLEVELISEFPLPDEPRDLALTGPDTGYISFPDSIASFRIEGAGSDRSLMLDDAVDSSGIDNPRGLTFDGQYLFVAQQGQQEEDAPPGVFSTNGQVIRFTVGPDGDLTDRTVIVDDVPTISFLHGINGLAVGPDSMIYLSIGGTLDQLDPAPPNSEWIGTVLRFDPEGESIEVFAKGLRNIYDLEFDSQGRLWGVDNDGPTYRGYRAEEVLQIKEGGDYGYPFEGTFGEYQVRTDGPIWAYTGHDVEGTAGIELTENLGLEPGLLVGARTLTHVPLSEDENGLYASTDFDFQGSEVVFARQGYFTIVEAGESGLLYVGVTGLSLESNLYLLQVSD